MKKRMDKKGAMTQFQVLSFIIGMIAVVLVVLYATGFFGTVGDIFAKVSSVEITAQACGGYASAGLESSYCNVFQKVDIAGVKQYATCEYLEDKIEVTFEKLGGDGCPDNQVTLAKNRCKTLKDDELVNGFPCYIDKNDVITADTPGDEWGISREHLV